MRHIDTLYFCRGLPVTWTCLIFFFQISLIFERNAMPVWHGGWQFIPSYSFFFRCLINYLADILIGALARPDLMSTNMVVFALHLYLNIKKKKIVATLLVYNINILLDGQIHNLVLASRPLGFNCCRSMTSTYFVNLMGHIHCLKNYIGGRRLP